MIFGRPARLLAGLAGAMLLAGLARAEEIRLPRSRPAPPGEADVTAVPARPAGAEAAALEKLARLPRPRPGDVRDPPSSAAAAPLEASVAALAPAVAEQAGAVAELALSAGPATVAPAIDLVARRPKARPLAPAALALVEPGAPDGIEPPPGAPAPIDTDLASCLKRLGTLGVEFTRLPAIEDGACRVAAPLNVTSLGSGVAIAPAAVLNCRTTEALALWVRDSLLPQAAAHLKSRPDGIVHDSAYVCRNRNNAPEGRLSEHATANAVDIASIGFPGRAPVAIGRSRDGAEARFESAIREDSCAYFTTVLGPGSNAAHATHFHFDAAQRRGGYRLCDLGTQIAGPPG